MTVYNVVGYHSSYCDHGIKPTVHVISQSFRTFKEAEEYLKDCIYESTEDQCENYYSVICNGGSEHQFVHTGDTLNYVDQNNRILRFSQSYKKQASIALGQEHVSAELNLYRDVIA